MSVVLVLMKGQISSIQNQLLAIVSSEDVAQATHKLLTAIVQVQALELWEQTLQKLSMAFSSWKQTLQHLSLVVKFININSIKAIECVNKIIL